MQVLILTYKLHAGCQLDFVKKKNGFYKRFNIQKKKVSVRRKKFFWGGKWISFQCQKKVFLLHAYLNKNSKNNNITQK